MYWVHEDARVHGGPSLQNSSVGHAGAGASGHVGADMGERSDMAHTWLPGGATWQPCHADARGKVVASATRHGDGR